MRKPWDNEPTTMTDLAQAKMSEFIIPAVHVEFAQNLERRLRHAERLLELCAEHTVTKYQDEALLHLEAARQEDGR